MRRDGDRFVLDARAVPRLAHEGHLFSAGHANSDLLAWPQSGTRLDLGILPLSIQSAFIQVQIASGDEALRWMQRVEVDPPLDEARDLAALATHMGLRAFHDWMRARLNGETIPAGDFAWDEDVGGSARTRSSFGDGRLTLEDILTAWARDPGAFARVRVLQSWSISARTDSSPSIPQPFGRRHRVRAERRMSRILSVDLKLRVSKNKGMARL
ncbi:hypothetical protein [Blastomonas sp. CCH13-E1]|uniref:hypothetical protein n=1 Tax=Blastomonas sp. CCH13-E1 TaxID=1768739 RepID=UPI000824DBBB|nr:hypothetical protein [Blastomonas sp. CCH13-E1]